MSTHFSPASIRFLRGLKKHNDRLWFDPRKSIYESELKAPLLAVIDEVNAALHRFAPEHVRPPAKVMMRIYRDTRFAKEKIPYKTHISAWWARQGLEKTSGAGFYFQLDPDEVLVAGGAYMPERDQLLAIRRHLLDHHADYRKIMRGRSLLAHMEPLDPARMTRAPKGFPAEHPALDLILQRQWGVAARLPADTALGPTLVNTLVEHFRLAAPLVHLLNTPLAATPAKKPLF